VVYLLIWKNKLRHVKLPEPKPVPLNTTMVDQMTSPASIFYQIRILHEPSSGQKNVPKVCHGPVYTYNCLWSLELPFGILLRKFVRNYVKLHEILGLAIERKKNPLALEMETILKSHPLNLHIFNAYLLGIEPFKIHTL